MSGLDSPRLHKPQTLDRECKHTQSEACGKRVDRTIQYLKANIKNRHGQPQPQEESRPAPDPSAGPFPRRPSAPSPPSSGAAIQTAPTLRSAPQPPAVTRICHPIFHHTSGVATTVTTTIRRSAFQIVRLKSASVRVSIALKMSSPKTHLYRSLFKYREAVGNICTNPATAPRMMPAIEIQLW